MSTLIIKNMVCDRCISSVRRSLEDLGYQVEKVRLGEAVVREEQSEKDLQEINDRLRKDGFELIRQPEAALVEEIKTRLIRYLKILEEDREEPVKLSKYLSDGLHRSYSHLSSQFSEHEDITIEQYFISLRIERAKELLSYGELTLSEIAHKLNYSSVSYLSNQFKKVVGMSVTDYKKASDTLRKPLDEIEES